MNYTTVLIDCLAGIALWLYSERPEVTGKARGIAKTSSLLCSCSAFFWVLGSFLGWLYVTLAGYQGPLT